jgi:hypothetical protein
MNKTVGSGGLIVHGQVGLPRWAEQLDTEFLEIETFVETCVLLSEKEAELDEFGKSSLAKQNDE